MQPWSFHGSLEIKDSNFICNQREYNLYNQRETEFFQSVGINVTNSLLASIFRIYASGT